MEPVSTEAPPGRCVTSPTVHTWSALLHRTAMNRLRAYRGQLEGGTLFRTRGRPLRFRLPMRAGNALDTHMERGASRILEPTPTSTASTWLQASGIIGEGAVRRHRSIAYAQFRETVPAAVCRDNGVQMESSIASHCKRATSSRTYTENVQSVGTIPEAS